MAGKLTLPHYGSPDDVEKVAGYLAGKPAGASEAELLKQLGTRCADPRKFELYDRLGLFRRDNGVFRLTPSGKRYVEGGDRKKRAIIQEAVRDFRPYHDVLARAADGGVDVLEADRVKHEWAEHFDGELDLENAYRTSAAPMTFFGVCEMAGLGTFVVGRRGAKSRLEFDSQKLSRYARGDEPEEAEPEAPPSSDPAPRPAAPAPAPAADAETAPPLIAESPVVSSGDQPPPVVRVEPTTELKNSARSDSDAGGTYTIAVPIFGKLARLVWVRPAMTVAEWEKFKKVGDAMFLDE